MVSASLLVAALSILPAAFATSLAAMPAMAMPAQADASPAPKGSDMPAMPAMAMPAQAADASPAPKGSDMPATPAPKGSDMPATPAAKGSDMPATPAAKGSDMPATPAMPAQAADSSPAAKGSDMKGSDMKGPDAGPAKASETPKAPGGMGPGGKGMDGMMGGMMGPGGGMGPGGMKGPQCMMGGAKHVVQVGISGLTFTPDAIYANPGDMVEFQFSAKNHSVVSSTFKDPCIPDDKMFSTFVPTTSLSTKTFTIMVTDTKPIWLYCSQNAPRPHCSAGMVAAINPPQTGNTLTLFKSMAMMRNSSASMSPSGGVAGGMLCDSGSPPSGGMMMPGVMPPKPGMAPSGAPMMPPAKGTGAKPPAPAATAEPAVGGGNRTNGSSPAQFLGEASGLTFSGMFTVMGLVAAGAMLL